MVHLTLQLGAALVIPFDTPRRMTNTGRGWRNRALRAAVASSEVVGCGRRCGTWLTIGRSVVDPGTAASLHFPEPANESNSAFGLRYSVRRSAARGLRDRSPCPDYGRHTGDAEPRRSAAPEHTARRRRNGRTQASSRRRSPDPTRPSSRKICSESSPSSGPGRWTRPSPSSPTASVTPSTRPPRRTRSRSTSPSRLPSVPAFQVFQALGEEAGTRATVQVDPLHHQVQVIHHV